MLLLSGLWRSQSTLSPALLHNFLECFCLSGMRHCCLIMPLAQKWPVLFRHQRQKWIGPPYHHHFHCAPEHSSLPNLARGGVLQSPLTLVSAPEAGKTSGNALRQNNSLSLTWARGEHSATSGRSSGASPCLISEPALLSLGWIERCGCTEIMGHAWLFLSSDHCRATNQTQ